jgi:integrase
VSIERIERKSGAVWRVRWRDELGRERSKVTGRKRDAEALEAEIVRRKRTGELDLLTGGKETLADFGQEWWRLYVVPNLGVRTQQSYAGLWDRHVLPRLGAMRLHSITPEEIERYRAELEATGVGPPTVYRALALLQGVLQRAVEWRRIGQNPVKLVRKPNIRRQRVVRPLSPRNVERLRAAANSRRLYGQRDAALISVLAYAGLRPQEALGLQWGDVRDRTLLIEKASDGQGALKATKTQHSRTVRILSPLAHDLAEWRLLRGRPRAQELVFPNLQGGVWNDRAWQTWHRDAWRPACKAADLNGVRPYDLRHSFVSLLIHEGRSVIDIARQAGHSPMMTLDVYGHVFDEFDSGERISAEEQIRRARETEPNVSVLCPPNPGERQGTQEIPANRYSPSRLPRISFMISSVPPPIGPRRASRTARSIPYSRM